eukprot:8144613-Pyramimonas_sp.AAC.1
MPRSLQPPTARSVPAGFAPPEMPAPTPPMRGGLRERARAGFPRRTGQHCGPGPSALRPEGPGGPRRRRAPAETQLLAASLLGMCPGCAAQGRGRPPQCLGA